MSDSYNNNKNTYLVSRSTDTNLEKTSSKDNRQNEETNNTKGFLFLLLCKLTIVELIILI